MIPVRDLRIYFLPTELLAELCPVLALRHGSKRVIGPMEAALAVTGRASLRAEEANGSTEVVDAGPM